MMLVTYREAFAPLCLLAPFIVGCILVPLLGFVRAFDASTDSSARRVLGGLKGVFPSTFCDDPLRSLESSKS